MSVQSKHEYLSKTLSHLLFDLIFYLVTQYVILGRKWLQTKSQVKISGSSNSIIIYY